MDVDGVAQASSMVSEALGAKNDDIAQQAQVSVLKKQLDTQQQSADALLKMMGVGQNLNVVG